MPAHHLDPDRAAGRSRSPHRIAPDSTGSRAGAHQNGTFPSARRAGKSESLDAWDRGTSNGTRVVIWDCHGGTNQKGNVNSDGTIVNVSSGLCLDACNADHANGTKLVLWSCNGQDNQRWSQT